MNGRKLVYWILVLRILLTASPCLGYNTTRFIQSFMPLGKGCEPMKTSTVFCICCSLLLVPMVGYSNPPYYSHGAYYPTTYYPPAQVYNNNTTVIQQQPYAVPLYNIGYQPQTAVISGSVAYQQSVTTTATAGSALGVQNSVQGMLGAELAMQQQQGQQSRLDRFIDLLEQVVLSKQAGQMQGQAAEEAHIADYRNNCMGCHKGSSARAKFQLFDEQGKFSAKPEDAGRIIFRLTTSLKDAKGKSLRMPPGGEPLDSTVKDRMIAGLIPVKSEDPKVAKKEDGF